MKRLTREELKKLVACEDGLSASIYFPTASAGRETLQNPVRLKNLLKKTRADLARAGLNEAAAEAFLQPVTALLDESPFWQLQDQGLALFVTGGIFAGYQTPFSLPEIALTGDGFHLKPLLPWLADDGQYLILALSKNSVRLFEASRYAIEEQPLDDVVGSQSEALRYDDPEKSLQVHSGSGEGAAGRDAGIIHGHGAAKEESKERVLRFFRKVDEGLRPYLRGREMPMLLAGVDYYLPIFREASTYARLMDEVISGNPDQVTLEELRQAAWNKVQPLFAQTRQKAREEMEEALPKNQAVTDIPKAVAAACHGRADKCFVALDEQHWGTYDAKSATVRSLETASPGRGRELLDLAATRTLLQGGEVFPEQTAQAVPGNGPLAVLLRY